MDDPTIAPAGRFCGKVNSWAPAFYSCSVSGGMSQDIERCSGGVNDADLTTGGMFQTAATCPQWAGYRDSTIGEVFANPACNQDDGFFTGGGFSFQSPAVDFVGSCIAGTCQVCKDGDTRCMSPSDGGIPQLCIDGRWRGYRGNGLFRFDLGQNGVQYHVEAQATLSAAVFTALCFAAMLCNVYVGVATLRGNERERERVRFNEKMEAMAAENSPIVVRNASSAVNSPIRRPSVVSLASPLQAASSKVAPWSVSAVP
mmetsp:Transcript_51503/g.134529  ORF Transcript_51503/g.134529 Transcript_51503/m.134529 type:complete len:257 (-) Transcript_51503:96-866(-)